MPLIILLLVAYLMVGYIEEPVYVKYESTQWSHENAREDLPKPTLFDGEIADVRVKYIEQWWKFATSHPTWVNLAKKHNVVSLEQQYINESGESESTVKYFDTRADDLDAKDLHPNWHHITVHYKHGDSKIVVDRNEDTADTYPWVYIDSSEIEDSKYAYNSSQ